MPELFNTAEAIVEAHADDPPTLAPPHGVMIDIETLDTKSSAVVLSVAAVTFEIWENGPVIRDDKLWIPSLREQLAAGRTVSERTVKWWGDQPRAAKDHWNCPQQPIIPVYRMLGDIAVGGLAGFIGENVPVWANGAVFDIGILESLCNMFGCDVPWKYNMVRDARTIYRDLRKLRERTSSPRWNNVFSTVHHPAHDCVNQIWGLWEHKPLFDSEG
jgi:hypothetical protein